MAASDIVLNAVFYAFAAAAIGGAVAVATSRNIVRSAFALLAVLFSVAALYAIMKADFLAAAQVLIYVGGILVLIIFAVMLTHRITDVNVSNESTPGPAAVFAVLCLFVALGITVLFTWHWVREPDGAAGRAGTANLVLYQYQADGKTGLAAGGNTHEDRVVLAARGLGPSLEGSMVDFEVASIPGWKDARKAEGKVVKGEVRAEVGGLPLDDPKTRFDKKTGLGRENRVHWRVKLRGLDNAASRPETDDQVDFTVHQGVTEPAARALAGRYLLAFEVVSVLLLAALVGAAFLARKEVKEA